MVWIIRSKRIQFCFSEVWMFLVTSSLHLGPVHLDWRMPFSSLVPGLFHSSPSPWAPLRRCSAAAFPRVLCLTWRLEIPTAVMTPNITRNMPPITGVGMVANAAPIFPNMPIRSSTQPAATITTLLPTCSTQGEGIEMVAELQPGHMPWRPLRSSWGITNNSSRGPAGGAPLRLMGLGKG